MPEAIQLEFDFIQIDRTLSALRQRALTSVDFVEYEFHRRRIDRMKAEG